MSPLLHYCPLYFQLQFSSHLERLMASISPNQQNGSDGGKREVENGWRRSDSYRKQDPLEGYLSYYILLFVFFFEMCVPVCWA